MGLCISERIRVLMETRSFLFNQTGGDSGVTTSTFIKRDRVKRLL